MLIIAIILVGAFAAQDAPVNTAVTSFIENVTFGPWGE